MQYPADKKKITKNIQKLEEVYQGITQILSNIDLINLSFQKAKTGKDTLCYKFAGNEIYLYSSYDPEKEAERLYSSFVSNGKNAAVILGTGIEYIIDKFLDSNKPVCIIEDNPAILKLLLSRIDLNDKKWDKIELILNFPNTNFEERIRRWFQKYRIDSYEIIVSQGMKKWNQKNIEKILSRIRELAVEAYQNITCNIVFQHKWFSNFLANYKKIYNGLWADQLIIQNRTEPVIVIGAGMSFKYNIDFVKEIAHKCIIIACDTILPVLLKEKIKPDLVVGIDAGEANLKDFEILKYMQEDFILTADAVLRPEAAYLHKGKTVWAMTPFTGVKGTVSPIIQYFEKKFYNKPFKWVSGGSVFHNALFLAAELFSGKIFLMGADFSYTYLKHCTETASYTDMLSGINKYCYIENPADEVLKVINKEGKEVFTDRVLLLYKRWIEENLHYFDAERLYNLSETGLKIQGVKDITENELKNLIIDKKKKTDIKYIKQKNELVIDFNNELKILREFEEDARNLLSICQKYLNDEENSNYAEIEEIYRNLEKYEIYPLVEELSAKVFIAARKYNKDKREEYILYYCVILTALIETCNYLKTEFQTI